MHDVAQWLEHHLREARVTRAYLFGSFYRGEPDPRDVDLIVVFDRIETVHNLSKLRSAFRDRFGLSLHIQKFHEQQSGLIVSFLQRTGSWEKLYE
jgi:predicted nucleotidyltransferase